MFFFNKRSKEPNGLLTDLYQLTMAQGYWKSGRKDAEGVFHLYFRKCPFKGGYAIAAGQADVISFINNFGFSKSDIKYLGSIKDLNSFPLFDKGFLKYLRNLKFSCDISGVREGTLVFPNEPILTIKGNIIQAQLLETPLLNIINFQTLIATKASRVVKAAGEAPILEFGLRRAQGNNGGMAASRAAYIGGCGATSNTKAGKDFNIPIKGTHSHSWVMSFPTELDAFKAFLNSQPGNTTLLIDTYDTIKGVRNAIKASRDTGIPLSAVRLDSGDLEVLSKIVRSILNKEGFKSTKIIVSNDLDEYKITKLKKNKAPIDIYGVGTSLVTAKDQPSLGGVYKLAAIREAKSDTWKPTIKLSEDIDKISFPGEIIILRAFKLESNPPNITIICDLLIKGQNLLYSHILLEEPDSSNWGFYRKDEQIDKQILKNIPANIIKKYGLDAEKGIGIQNITDVLYIDGKLNPDYNGTNTNISRLTAVYALNALSEDYKKLYVKKIFPVILSKGLKELRQKLIKELKL